MKAILPTKKFNPEAAFAAGVKDFEDTVVKRTDELFDKTHATWSGESTPDSIIEKSTSGYSVEWFVGREGAIYSYVSRGTGPRLLESDTPMFFNSEFTPKTKAGSLDSGFGGSGGMNIGPVWEVWHETEPRDFDITVHKYISDYIPSRANKISKKIAKNIWR